MRSIIYQFEYPYAIVRAMDDYMWNNDESEIILFRTKEEYEEWKKNALEEQPYTGKTYTTLWCKSNL